METLIHADIFFFVTTIAVVVIGVVLAAVLIYLSVILRDVRAVVRKGRGEAEAMLDDLRGFRERVKAHGVAFSDFLSFFKGAKQNESKRSKQNKHNTKHHAGEK